MALYDLNDSQLEESKNVARSQNVNFKILPDAGSIKSKFPFLNPLNGTVGLFEPSRSGAINPRKLLNAQQQLATKHGVTHMKDIVTKVAYRNPHGFQVQMKSSEKFNVNKIILCAGAFLGHNDLLPKNFSIDAFPKLISTTRVSVDENLVKKYSTMPSISMKKISSGAQSGGFDDPFYLMAPIMYPDGE